MSLRRSVPKAKGQYGEKSYDEMSHDEKSYIEKFGHVYFVHHHMTWRSLNFIAFLYFALDLTSRKGCRVHCGEPTNIPRRQHAMAYTVHPAT